jgi:hypothetical protein
MCFIVDFSLKKSEEIGDRETKDELGRKVVAHPLSHLTYLTCRGVIQATTKESTAHDDLIPHSTNL